MPSHFNGKRRNRAMDVVMITKAPDVKSISKFFKIRIIGPAICVGAVFFSRTMITLGA